MSISSQTPSALHDVMIGTLIMKNHETMTLGIRMGMWGELRGGSEVGGGGGLQGSEWGNWREEGAPIVRWEGDHRGRCDPGGQKERLGGLWVNHWGGTQSTSCHQAEVLSDTEAPRGQSRAACGPRLPEAQSPPRCPPQNTTCFEAEAAHIPICSTASRSGALSTRKTGSCWRGSRGEPQR